VKSGHLPTKGRSENHTHTQAGNKKEKQGLLVYSVREMGEQRYANNSEKRTEFSIKSRERRRGHKARRQRRTNETRLVMSGEDEI
jgi:hypothetical protein